VKESIFFEILKCMDVQLSAVDQNWIKKWFGLNQKIKWQEPVKILAFEGDDWVLRKGSGIKKRD